MKLFIFVIFAVVVCASARPGWDFDILGQGQAAAGFATGVVAVPAAGLGGGAIGFVAGGPKGALATGAQGAHGGTNLAQTVGGQRPGYGF